MKKSVFTNKIFYYLLVAFIIALLIYNSILSIKDNNIYGIIPIAIEIALLVLIFTKDRYAKLSIIIWAVIFSIIGNGFDAIAYLMDAFNDGFKTIPLYSFLYDIVGLVIGILIIDYTRRTVILERVSSENESK
jgi:hypothetical protein